MAKLSKTDWRKTPYAKSEAANPEGSIQSLLAKYRVKNIQMTHCVGEHGRPAFIVRFQLSDKTYRIGLEVLDAVAEERERLVQAKRAVYHYIKSQLEIATVFWTTEEALFAFLELPGGDTVFEATRPHLEKMQSLKDFTRPLLLGPAEEDHA